MGPRRATASSEKDSGKHASVPLPRTIHTIAQALAEIRGLSFTDWLTQTVTQRAIEEAPAVQPAILAEARRLQEVADTIGSMCCVEAAPESLSD